MKRTQAGTRRERRQARADMTARFFENARIPPRFRFEPTAALVARDQTLYLGLANGMLVKVRNVEQLQTWTMIWQSGRRGEKAND